MSYDDASNNRSLISGKGALIMNPPSAWAVAKRDAPQVASDCWHFPCPTGPKGRYCPYNYCFYGVWSFGRNKTAAKELIQYLQERKQVGEREVASDGYDLPPLLSMSDFDIGRRSTAKGHSLQLPDPALAQRAEISLPIRRRRTSLRRCIAALSIRPCWQRSMLGNRTRK